MSARVDGRRAGMADLARPELGARDAVGGDGPLSEVRGPGELRLGGDGRATGQARTRRRGGGALGAVAPPVMGDAGAAALVAVCERLAGELDRVADAGVDPSVLQALAPRLAALRAMTQLVRNLLGLRHEVANRRRAERRA